MWACTVCLGLSVPIYRERMTRKHLKLNHCEICSIASVLQMIASHFEYKLTLKAPIRTAADGIHKYFFIFLRENKT